MGCPNIFMNRRTYYDLIRERISRASSEAALAAQTMDRAALTGNILVESPAAGGGEGKAQ